MKKSDLRKIIRETIEKFMRRPITPPQTQAEECNDGVCWGDYDCQHLNSNDYRGTCMRANTHDVKGCCIRTVLLPDVDVSPDMKEEKALEKRKSSFKLTPISTTKGGDLRAPDRKHHIEPETPLNLPNYGASSAFTAYYVCGYIPQPHGHGAGCYDIPANGVYISPYSGQAAYIPCVPWWQGGSCFGYKHNSDIPSQYINSERSCNGPWNWQTHPNGPAFGGCQYT